MPEDPNNYHYFTAPSTGFVTQAEAAVAADETPTFGGGTDIPIWTGRDYLPFSIELQQDQPDWQDNMLEMFSNGYQEYVSSKTATGSGSSDVTGVFTRMQNTTTSPSHVTVTTAGTIGSIDIRATWAALPERYRVDPSCAWMMSPSVEQQISALAAAGGDLGYQDWIVNPNDGQVRLLGRPVLSVSDAPSFTGTTGSESFLVLGSWNRYIVATRLDGYSIDLIPHLRDTSTGRPTGERAYFAYARLGGDVVDPGAFRILSNT